jgi:nucleotide-binding universal stress UspA family protein
MGTSPIPFGTILAAVAPRSSNLHPLGAAFAIARRTGARVAVLAVATAPWELLGSDAGASTTTPSRGRLLRLAAERLARRLDTSLGADLGDRARVQVAIGIPAIEIVRAADALGADLIVVARLRGPQPGDPPNPDGADFVSATVRRARVPCLVVPEKFAGCRGIVAALDGTPAARDVLDAARRAGAACGVPVTAVHVAAPALVPAGAAAPASWAPVAGVEVVVRAGDPVVEILAAARDAGANVVALGQHRGRPADASCRSMAARLLARAPGAALTVPL